jgi:hypothetical protein
VKGRKRQVMVDTQGRGLIRDCQDFRVGAGLVRPA